MKGKSPFVGESGRRARLASRCWAEALQALALSDGSGMATAIGVAYHAARHMAALNVYIYADALWRSARTVDDVLAEIRCRVDHLGQVVYLRETMGFGGPYSLLGVAESVARSEIEEWEWIARVIGLDVAPAAAPEAAPEAESKETA